MNADDFRQLYEYHFTINRKIREQCIAGLAQAQFVQKVNYSVGSVRNQVVHMMNIDERWFCALRGEKVPGFLNPVYFHKRDVIRQKWDKVEADMRAYLHDLLHSQPFLEGDDPIQLWQVLIHVANHGTDHRAQLLSLLNSPGVKTFPQDYAFFVVGKM